MQSPDDTLEAAPGQAARTTSASAPASAKQRKATSAPLLDRELVDPEPPAELAATASPEPTEAADVSSSEPQVSAPTDSVESPEGTETAAAGGEAAVVESPANERQRIKDQLEALKRRESELRRALAIAEHPGLGEAIRVIEGRTYAVTKAQEKLTQGLSKSEERRRDTLDKKVAGLREKRTELDAQIAALDSELAALGVDRIRGHEADKRAALEQLVAALGAHGGELSSAGLEAGQLVPELEAWLPEVQAIAEQLAHGGQTPIEA